MDLTKFNENYRVVSEEAVEVCYDIILRDYLGSTSEDATFQDLINGYEEQDGRIWSNEPVKYFIYEGVTEVFYTTNEEELLREIKRLANRLKNQEETGVDKYGEQYLDMVKLIQELKEELKEGGIARTQAFLDHVLSNGDVVEELKRQLEEEGY